MNTLSDYLIERRSLIETALDARFQSAGASLQPVLDAMRYAVMNGGKRIRPLLALAITDLKRQAPDTVLDAACAVELIHTASLILDDLPSMDNAAERRGKPATHVAYGEATALLAAVALIALAFELVARNAARLGTGTEAVRVLAESIGVNGLIGGQQLDLSALPVDTPVHTLTSMHHQKTGALFVASMHIPALLLGCTAIETEALREYAAHLGLAFQITDDLLDNTDENNEDKGKATFVNCLGAVPAQQRARDHIRQAIQAVACFGEAAAPLQQMAELIGGRTA